MSGNKATTTTTTAKKAATTTLTFFSTAVLATKNLLILSNDYHFPVDIYVDYGCKENLLMCLHRNIPFVATALQIVCCVCIIDEMQVNQMTRRQLLFSFVECKQGSYSTQ